MFQEIPQESFDSREKRVLKFWQDNHIFKKSVGDKHDRPFFSFYDGPPFATGLPHYGHLLAGTIKDVVARYKTMKGYCVPRPNGWDCHGLPVESEIEKAHNLTGAKAIEEYGIAKFNEECRSIVLRYTGEWRTVIERMGRWVDFDNTWKTMDKDFMESVWWVFKQLYDRGLVYEGYKVVPYSAKLGTPLSNFEAGENYKEIDDPSLTVAFEFLDEPNTYMLVWTTTPWTLVSNLAIMVGPQHDYVKVKDNKDGRQFILSPESLPNYYKDPSDYTMLGVVKGIDLIGKRYIPLFDYFKDRAADGAFVIISEESVDFSEGTGAVHCAPAFGEVDFYAAKRNNIDLVCPIDVNGQFTKEIPEYTGLFVKDADKQIIKRLKDAGKVIHHGTCRHRYPFCWRSDTPLIYRAVNSWFVSVEKIKDRLVKANTEIHWTPDHLKYGRFGKWLEGARDWAVSRNRYWGTPIPLWRSEDGELICVGSVDELEELTGAKVDDLHRQFIDALTIDIRGKTFYRVREVFDCWFESGSVPYAKLHYPFEHREHFAETFPADFIAEGLDQTRGWFYTLMVISTALFDKPAFKNVVVNGILLAEDGSKMSKRLRNYPDPMEVVHRHGADSIRLYMMHSPAVKGDDLNFSERGVELVLRQALIPMWNAYSFFITYARLYHWVPVDLTDRPEAVIDRWILSHLHKLIKEVEQGMDAYDLSRAVEPFVGFIDNLTNWYIRRSRRRFWSDKASSDRDEAFSTLYLVLLELSKIAAPFVPFISETIYQNLRSEVMPESVHLTDFPVYFDSIRDEALEEGMSAVQAAVSMGHALRKENMLKVRQPLPKAFIACGDAKQLAFLEEQKALIIDELNVKDIEFGTDETQFVRLKAKPNFRVLGKKVGKLMPQAKSLIEAFSQHQLSELLDRGVLTINLEGEDIVITPEDVQVDREVHEGLIASNSGEITIALDTTLTEELLIEGLAREIVNKVNTMRREAGLEVADRIHLKLQTTNRVSKAFDLFGKGIQNEVLALSVAFGPCDGQQWDLNGEDTKIEIIKA